MNRWINKSINEWANVLWREWAVLTDCWRRSSFSFRIFSYSTFFNATPRWICSKKAIQKEKRKIHNNEHVNKMRQIELCQFNNGSTHTKHTHTHTISSFLHFHSSLSKEVKKAYYRRKESLLICPFWDRLKLYFEIWVKEEAQECLNWDCWSLSVRETSQEANLVEAHLFHINVNTSRSKTTCVRVCVDMMLIWFAMINDSNKMLWVNKIVSMRMWVNHNQWMKSENRTLPSCARSSLVPFATCTWNLCLNSQNCSWNFTNSW
jgi:hypothetical protein